MTFVSARFPPYLETTPRICTPLLARPPCKPREAVTDWRGICGTFARDAGWPRDTLVRERTDDRETPILHQRRMGRSRHAERPQCDRSLDGRTLRGNLAWVGRRRRQGRCRRQGRLPRLDEARARRTNRDRREVPGNLHRPPGRHGQGHLDGDGRADRHGEGAAVGCGFLAHAQLPEGGEGIPVRPPAWRSRPERPHRL